MNDAATLDTSGVSVSAEFQMNHVRLEIYLSSAVSNFEALEMYNKGIYSCYPPTTTTTSSRKMHCSSFCSMRCLI